MPPVVAAALEGHDSTLGLLLGAGGDVNATNAHGTTALHAAAAGGHKGCVQWLLAAGAAADARNRDGATPLAQAAFHGQTACVQQLLAAGADVSGADNDSDTPLLWAASHNEQPDTVALLLGACASVAETNRFGETALHLAAKKGLTAVLRALVEAPGVLPVLQARCCKGARLLPACCQLDPRPMWPVEACCLAASAFLGGFRVSWGLCSQTSCPSGHAAAPGVPSICQGLREPMAAPVEHPSTCSLAPPPTQQG